MLNGNKSPKQDGDTLEEIIGRQIKTLQELNMATVLTKGKQNIKDELQKAREEIEQISGGIGEAKKMLLRLHEQNVISKEICMLLETLDKKILHQENNVPLELIQSYQNATVLSPDVLECMVNQTHRLTVPTPSSVRSTKMMEKQEMKDCKRMLFNEPEVCPVIPFITAEEFNNIPKYIIGRQTVNSLETINNFISAINQTLIAKYTILSIGKVAAQKRGEINLYLQYKRQEYDMRGENGYLYFFTAEDYYGQTKTKIDKTKLNFLTALRHCKRLRECRIKNELRYVITP